MAHGNDTMRVKRFTTGCYRITYRGRFFEAMTEAYRSEGASAERVWLVIETEPDFGEGRGGDGYWNHFATLGDCKDAIRFGCDEDATKEQ